MFNEIKIKTDAPYDKHNLWLLYYVDAFFEDLKKSKYSTFLSDVAKTNLSIILFNQLFVIAYDCLHIELISKIGEKNITVFFGEEHATEEEKIEASNVIYDRLVKGGKDYFDKEAPQLQIELNKRYDLFKSDTYEMLERLFNDRELISRDFFNGDRFEIIEDIKSATEDIHNGGRYTATIFSNVGNLIYKPHSLEADSWFCGVAKRYFNNIIHVPVIISVNGEYGYSKFIENNPVSKTENISEYYCHLGGLLAILQMFNAYDYHKENIIADGIYPVPVDFETITNPFPFEKGRIYENISEMEYMKSVISKGMLPAYSYYQKTEYSPCLDTSDRNVSMPCVNGEKISVIGYENDFIKGFIDTYQYCIRIKNEKIDTLSGIDNAAIRIIPKNSQYYGDILKMSYKKRNLRSIETRKNPTRILYENKEPGDSKCEFAKAEEDAILLGDIPYFHARANEKNIYTSDRVVMKDSLIKTPNQFLCDSVMALSSEDLELQVELIKRSFALAKVDNEKNYYLDDLLDDSLDIDRMEQEIDYIFKTVRDNSVKFKNGSYDWIRIGDSGVPELYNTSYFDGSTGLALFFAKYALHTKNEEHKKEALMLSDKCLDKLADSMPYIKVKLSGTPKLAIGELGIGGVIKALIEIKKLTNNKKTDCILDETFNLIKDIDYSNYAYTDVYSGLSGLIEALCLYDEGHDNEEKVRFIKKIADKIISLQTLEYEGTKVWATINNNRPISGWGHGLIGIASALTLAYRVTKDDKYLRGARDAFIYEHNVYSDELGTWPDFRESSTSDKYMHGLCSGAPGIGNALIKMNSEKDNFETYDEDLKRAINACVRLPINSRDHLCCGNSSLIDFFVNLYELTNEYDHIKQANKIMNVIYNRKQKYGSYIFIPANMRLVTNSSFYQGLSGLGYEMIRLLEINASK